MRLFFGLKPDPQTVVNIADWRAKTLPPLERPVPMGNLHITLVFLGQVSHKQMEELCDEARKQGKQEVFNSIRNDLKMKKEIHR